MRIIAAAILIISLGLSQDKPPASETPAHSHNKSGSQWGVSLGSQVMLASYFLPDTITYRRSNPFMFELALEANLGRHLHFEIFGNYGMGSSSGVPFYCLECNADAEHYISETRIGGGGFKYLLKKHQESKKLWVTLSGAVMSYNWQNERQRNSERKLQSRAMFLGMFGESYLIRKKIMLGITLDVRIPIAEYMEIYYDDIIGWAASDEGLHFAPLVGLGLRVKYNGKK